DLYYLQAGRQRAARVEQDLVGAYWLTLLEERQRIWQERLGKDLAVAIRRADARVLRAWPDATGLVLEQTRWRQDPPSSKQLQLLERKGVTPRMLQGVTKGQAAKLIASLFGKS